MKSSIAALFFGLGILCFICWLLFPEHSKYFDLCGWMLLVFAYLAVLRQNYKMKAPVPTRGGWVEYAKKPGVYRAIYLLLFIIGVWVLLTLLVFTILRK